MLADTPPPGEAVPLNVTHDHGARILEELFGGAEIVFFADTDAVVIPFDIPYPNSMSSPANRTNVRFFITAKHARGVGGVESFVANLALHGESATCPLKLVADSIPVMTAQLNNVFDAAVYGHTTVISGGTLPLVECICNRELLSSQHPLANRRVDIHVSPAPHWEVTTSSTGDSRGLTIKTPMQKRHGKFVMHFRTSDGWFRAEGLAPSTVNTNFLRFLDSLSSGSAPAALLEGVVRASADDIAWQVVPEFITELAQRSIYNQMCDKSRVGASTITRGLFGAIGPVIIPGVKPGVVTSTTNPQPTDTAPTARGSGQAANISLLKASMAVARDMSGQVKAESIFGEASGAPAVEPAAHMPVESPDEGYEIGSRFANVTGSPLRLIRRALDAHATQDPTVEVDIGERAWLPVGDHDVMSFTSHGLATPLANVMCNPFFSDLDAVTMGLDLQQPGQKFAMVRVYIRLTGVNGINLYGWRGTRAEGQRITQILYSLYGGACGIHVWSMREGGRRPCNFRSTSWLAPILQAVCESSAVDYSSRQPGQRSQVIAISLDGDQDIAQRKLNAAAEVNATRAVNGQLAMSVKLVSSREAVQIIERRADRFDEFAMLNDDLSRVIAQATSTGVTSEFMTELLDPVAPCDQLARYQMATVGDSASDYLPSVPICQASIVRLGLSLAAPSPVVVSIYPDGVETAVLAVPAGYSAFAIPIPSSFVVLPEYKTALIQGGAMTAQRASVNLSSNLLNVSSTMYYALTRSPFANISGPINTPDDLPTVAIGAVVPGITMQVGADIHYPSAALGPGYVCNTLGQVAGGVDGIINAAASNVSIFANTASVGGSGITSGSELGSATTFPGIRIGHQINAYSNRTFCPANMFSGVAGAGNYTMAQVQAAADLSCTSGTPCKMTFAGVRGPVNFNGSVTVYANSTPISLSGAAKSWFGSVVITSLTTNKATQVQTANTYSLPASLAMSFGSDATVNQLTVSWNYDMRVQGAIVDIKVLCSSLSGTLTTTGVVTQWTSVFNMVPLVKPSPVPMLIIGGLPNSATNVTELVVSYKAAGRVVPLQATSQVLGVPSAGVSVPRSHEVKALVMNAVAGGYTFLMTRGLGQPNAPRGSYELLSSASAEDRGYARLLAHAASRDLLAQHMANKTLALADGVPQHLATGTASGLGDIASAAAGIASALPVVGPLLGRLLSGLASSGVASAAGRAPKPPRRANAVPAWPSDAAMGSASSNPLPTVKPRKRGGLGVASGQPELAAVDRQVYYASGCPPTEPNHVLSTLMSRLSMHHEHPAAQEPSRDGALELLARWMMTNVDMRAVVEKAVDREEEEQYPAEFKAFLDAVARDVWRPNDGVVVTLEYQDEDYRCASAGPAYTFSAQRLGVPVTSGWPEGDYLYRHGHNATGGDDPSTDYLEQATVPTTGSASAAGKRPRHFEPVTDRLHDGYVEYWTGTSDDPKLTTSSAYLTASKPIGAPARYRFPVVSDTFTALCDVAVTATPDMSLRYFETKNGNFVTVDQDAFKYCADMAALAVDAVGLYFTVRAQPRVSSLSGASAGAAMLAAVFGLRNDVVYTGALVTSLDAATNQHVVSGYLAIDHADLVAKEQCAEVVGSKLVYLHDVESNTPHGVICWCPSSKRPAQAAGRRRRAAESAKAAGENEGPSGVAETSAARLPPWAQSRKTDTAPPKRPEADIADIQGWFANPEACAGQLRKLFDETTALMERRAAESGNASLRVSEIMSMLGTFRSRFESWLRLDANRKTHKYLFQG